jgi:hypothetical protein
VFGAVQPNGYVEIEPGLAYEKGILRSEPGINAMGLNIGGFECGCSVERARVQPASRA